MRSFRSPFSLGSEGSSVHLVSRLPNFSSTFSFFLPQYASLRVYRVVFLPFPFPSSFFFFGESQQPRLKPRSQLTFPFLLSIAEYVITF